MTTDAWAEPSDRGTSGPDGAYHIAVPEADFWKNFSDKPASNPRLQMSILVSAEGLGPDWVNLDADDKGMKPEYVRDYHLVADRPIEGRIIGATGRPVVGGRVAVSDLSAPADGRWGPVLDALKALDSKLLYPHAYPWSSPINRSAMSVIPAAMSGADGRFRLTGVGRDRLVHLRVTGPGVLPRDFMVLTRDDVDEPTRAIREKHPRTPQPGGPATAKAAPGNPGVPLFGPTPEVDVDPARTISGVVLAADTGEPVQLVSVGVLNGFEQIRPDARGQYRGLRGESPAFTVLAWNWSGDYLDAARKFEDADAPGEVVADFRSRGGASS